MIIKLTFNRGFIDASSQGIVVLENPYGGVRTVNVEFFYTFWTGTFHILGGNNIKFQITNVIKIETRSSLDEDDESWVSAWERTKPWSYAVDKEAAEILEKLTY